MFSIPLLITTLYPEKTAQEQESLATQVERAVDYEERDIPELKSQDLMNPKIVANLLRTLYESQFSQSGVADEIMRKMEEWSSGTLVFPFMDDADEARWERYYTFLGFINFNHISEVHQVSLLATRRLLLACDWDVSIYTAVQSHFAMLAFVAHMKQSAALMIAAIEQNTTMLGDAGRIRRTIGEWALRFKGFFGSTASGKVDEFMESNMEVSRLSPPNRDALAKILTLYYGLMGGFIWREIPEEAGVPLVGLERKTEKDNKQIWDYYLEHLLAADEQGIADWLSDHEAVAHWLDVMYLGDLYLSYLLFIVKEKVNLSDAGQVQNLFRLLEDLKERGAENIDDVLYFDESQNAFVWDESFFVGITEEDILNPPRVVLDADGDATDALPEQDVSQIAPTIGEYKSQ